MPLKTFGYAAQAASSPLEPFRFTRRDPLEKDVEIDILYCGVCHSDLHQVRSHWAGTRYPCVPGHEIVGRVSAVGSKVTRFSVGDIAAVGCMVASCRECASCQEGLEQYCERGFTGTYNGHVSGAGENTYGGYSDRIVVDEHFVLRIRHAENQLSAAAPLLCAGITTWSPLRHWGAGPGKKVGIVGVGGLGHMGIKLAHAFGAYVVAFTTSDSKRQAALDLGADEVVVSKNEAEMKAHTGSFHFILNTVSARHNLDPFIELLKRDGTLTLVGAPEHAHPSPTVFNMIFGRKSLAGSLIGGIPETQEMLDFCAQRGIVSDVEMIAIQDIEKAYARMLKSDVKYRFVIDMASLRTSL
jgi:alcohol dehydrogenase (NADP+)